MRSYQHRSTHLQRARQNEQNNGEISPEEIQRNRERAQRGINKYIAKYKEHMAKQAAISSPEDAPEKEADEVARKVSEEDGKEVDNSTAPQGNEIQRNAEEEEVMPKSEKEEVMPKGDDEEVMSKEDDGGLHATEELQAKLETNKGGGQTMDDNIRGEMEGKMGADLGDVRIHTGPEAHDMAEGINAKAFTYGQDVYFKNGNYNPGTPQGKHLLAHELTHTQQQKGADVGRMVQRSLEIGGTRINNIRSIEAGLTTQVNQWHDDTVAFLKEKMGKDFDENTHVTITKENAVLKGKEIVRSMISAEQYTSKNIKGKKISTDYEFKYDDINALYQDVLFRLSLIQNIAFANLELFARYPSSALGEKGLNLRDPDWQEASDPAYAIKPSGFELKNDIDPSTAIDNLYKQGATATTDQRILVDCTTMLGIIHYRSLQQTMGKDDFNAEFKNKKMKIGPLGAIFGKDQQAHTLKKYFKVVFIASLDDLVPGDRVDFKNTTAYKKIAPTGLMQGEFAIYTGKVGKQHMFEGFGLKRSYEEMVLELHQAYIDAGGKGNINEVMYEANGNSVTGKVPGMMDAIHRFDLTKLGE
jgi:uncharacterized protein YehS (DUF1456 family)